MRLTNSHSRSRTIIRATLVATLAVGLMAGSVFAAKPAGGGGGKPGGGGSTTNGTIVMVPMDGATEAHFAARVTFTVSTGATPYPYVHLVCRQGGAVVGEGRQGFFSTALGNKWFYLGPTPLWQSGAADCTATLEKSGNRGSWTVLATTSFHVYE
jgi:hypothetical protein